MVGRSRFDEPRKRTVESMLPVTIRRVFMAHHRIDFRKQFNGLLGEAYGLGANPYEGDCVLFVKKDHTQLRVLVGDDVGLYFVCRRFEGGRLRTLLKFSEEPTRTSISTAELSLLLEGATFTVHKRARSCRRTKISEPMSASAVRLQKGVDNEIESRSYDHVGRAEHQQAER